MLLSVENLRVKYGNIEALHGVSFTVEKGEIVTLIGANGAGKTTLLSAISGVMRVSGGDIAFDGRPIANDKPERIVRLGLSHVPERRLVFGPMSVEDNLLLGAYSRYNRREAAADMDEVYAMFPVLRDRRGQQAAALSGGEQQMLAIGRALMARPRCLLLDEPGMGLAPQICKEIFRHVVGLRRDKGLTVLLVEQNAKSALAVADRGYVLETGRVLLSGTAEELLANNDVRRAYLGREKDA